MAKERTQVDETVVSGVDIRVLCVSELSASEYHVDIRVFMTLNSSVSSLLSVEVYSQTNSYRNS